MNWTICKDSLGCPWNWLIKYELLNHVYNFEIWLFLCIRKKLWKMLQLKISFQHFFLNISIFSFNLFNTFSSILVYSVSTFSALVFYQTWNISYLAVVLKNTSWGVYDKYSNFQKPRWKYEYSRYYRKNWSQQRWVYTFKESVREKWKGVLACGEK